MMAALSLQQYRVLCWILFLCFLCFVGDYTYFRRDEVWSTRMITKQTKNCAAVGVIHEATTTASNEGPIQFVFFAGIEGTGHHLLRSLVKASPAVAQMADLHLRPVIKTLQEHLETFWLSKCHTRHETDMNAMYQQLVQQLRIVQERALAANYSGTIFLNVERSMLSYPYYMDDTICRPLHYPDLDDLYTACDEAVVDCGHVYLYRDPYEVVQSTTQKRSFNPTVVAATQLYTTMLHVILAQLVIHSHRTLGCWGFHNNLPTTTTENPDLVESVRTILGWNSTTEFQNMFREIYHPHATLTEAKRTEIVPPELEISMQSMVQAHERTLQLCRNQVRDNI